ncbi:hypothetical protein F5051DRAFT_426258 [Lentinula edodes]|nr:hypothetical protein F5051DRAFT_426258 [Lentinula edodes]
MSRRPDIAYPYSRENFVPNLGLFAAYSRQEKAFIPATISQKMLQHRKKRTVVIASYIHEIPKYDLYNFRLSGHIVLNFEPVRAAIPAQLFTVANWVTGEIVFREFVETFQFIAEDSFLYATYKPSHYLNMKPAVLQVFQVIIYGSQIRQYQRLRDVEVNEPKYFLQSVDFIPRAGPPMKALKLWNPDGLDHFCLTKSTFSDHAGIGHLPSINGKRLLSCRGGAIRVRHPQGQGWKMSSWIQEDPPVNANDSFGDNTFVATATEDNASTRRHVYFTEDCIFMIEYWRDGTMEGRIYTY